MMALDVGVQVRAAAQRDADRVAIIDQGRTLSFGSLVDRIDRVANGAANGLGLQSGAGTGVLAYSCLEYVELVLGLAAAGSPATLLNARLSATELGHLIDDCDLRVLFVQPALRDLAEAAAHGRGVRIVEIGPAYEAWLAQASSAAPRRRSSPEDVFCIASTGGTTGRSKGVVLSQRSRGAMFGAMAEVFGCYGPGDRNLAVAPMFHGAGFNFCFSSLYFGGSVVLLGKFDPEGVWRAMAEHGVTNASVVPTHLAAMFGLPGAPERARAAGRLKALICNGAPLPPSMKQLGHDLWDGAVLSEAYGGTEAGVISTMSPQDLLRRPDSVGRIFPGVCVELRGEDGAPVPRGQMGEVHTASPYHFDGYVGGPPHHPGDWFSGGDLAIQDEEGFLHLLDRKGEKIISGGVNIYPSEVELAIADHPAVAEVAVFGVPDAYWGEVVHALVTLAPGADATADELHAFAAGKVGRLKAPKSVGFRQALPKSAAGKVLRRVLRDEHRAAHSPPVGAADVD